MKNEVDILWMEGLAILLNVIVLAAAVLTVVLQANLKTEFKEIKKLMEATHEDVLDIRKHLQANSEIEKVGFVAKNYWSYELP